jgi:hypothetical protein
VASSTDTKTVYSVCAVFLNCSGHRGRRNMLNVVPEIVPRASDGSKADVLADFVSSASCVNRVAVCLD